MRITWPSWHTQLPSAIIVSAVVAIVFSTAGEVWQKIANRLAPPPVIFPMPVPAQEDLSPLKVERCRTDACVEQRLRGIRLSAPELTREWNSGKGRVVIGSPSQPRPWLYLAEALKGFEAQYERLQNRGLAGYLIHEVHIPRQWLPEQLGDKLYKWAAECTVQREWIARWSSFKQERAEPQTFGFPGLGVKKLESECRPGGTCLIVAKHCPQGAFFPLTR